MNTIQMMGNTQEQVNSTGQACPADGWFGHVDGLHTIVFKVMNFTGRLIVEASLALDPTEKDWYVVSLFNETPYLQFPQNPILPTGHENMGDTATVGVSFYINTLWLRVRMDRSYLETSLYERDREELASLGNVVKVTMAR